MLLTGVWNMNVNSRRKYIIPVVCFGWKSLFARKKVYREKILILIINNKMNRRVWHNRVVSFFDLRK